MIVDTVTKMLPFCVDCVDSETERDKRPLDFASLLGHESSPFSVDGLELKADLAHLVSPPFDFKMQTLRNNVGWWTDIEEPV